VLWAFGWHHCVVTAFPLGRAEARGDAVQKLADPLQPPAERPPAQNRIYQKNETIAGVRVVQPVDVVVARFIGAAASVLENIIRARCPNTDT
jgi:hypothetical protein